MLCITMTNKQCLWCAY